jgi:serine/threonine-protein kinase
MSSSTTDPRTFLGRYRAVRLLGEGGTSRVYLAQPLAGGREVVVKVLHAHLSADPRFRDCFQREMILLQRFRHPNAVELLEAAADDEHGPCIVMEYIPGVTLDTLLERHGRLSPLRVGRLLVQVCRVLQAAHNRGITHRDLKPANLMVVLPDTPTELIKVMDFGLGRLASALYIPLEQLARTGHDHAAGTPEYISPEELRRDPVDHRCDLYSLGVILFQLLTGRLPFTGNVTELFEAHTERRPPALADAGVSVPPGIEAVVQACLAKYPSERPQSARELAQRYERGLGRPIITQPIEEPTAPLPPDDPPTASPVEKVIDANTIVHQLEAFMPEKIAVVKLRGFVEDIGGEAIESMPGLIRVRLEDRREPAAASGNSMLSWFGLKRKGAAAPAPRVTLMELHMQKKEAERQNLLQLTILLRPGRGRQQALDPEWRAYCDTVFRELRAYLMGRG